MRKFVPKKGSNLTKKKAQIYGEELERIREMYNGELNTTNTLNEAKNVNSPIHNEFTWDNSICGEKYRKQQANRLINSIEIVIVSKKQDTPNIQTKYFVNQTKFNSGIKERQKGGSKNYLVINDVLSDKQKRKNEIEDFKRKIISVCDRYKCFSEISKKIKSIEKIINEIE